jgi:hypothetical protein
MSFGSTTKKSRALRTKGKFTNGLIWSWGWELHHKTAEKSSIQPPFSPKQHKQTPTFINPKLTKTPKTTIT